MKNRLGLTVLLLAGAVQVRAEMLAQWNFNDTNGPVLSPPPSQGAGAARILGGVSASYVGGVTADGGSAGKAWSTTKYPGATASNQTAGVRFDVATSGYEQISVSWYQENSDTASRYGRLQYTVDGVNFVDAPGGMVGMSKGGVYTNQVVDLSRVAGVENNGQFGFRLVTEFEASALGAGTNAYVATGEGHSYSSGGTIHFDLVTVSGTPMPDGNTRPYIFPAIPAQSLRPGESTLPLAFTVLDAEEPASNLVLTASSSAPAVVAAGNIVFGGSAAERTVRVTAGSASGVAEVTIAVVDSGGKSNGLSFQVTVLPANDPPTISGLAHAHTLVSQPVGPLAFTVGDRETAAEELSVSSRSANARLLPEDAAHLVVSGSGSNRTVTLVPAAGQVGNVPVTLSVSDGSNTSSAVFALMVRPSTNVVFYEPFEYGDGPLVARSGFLWGHRASTASVCLVTNGWLHLAAEQAEDPKAPLVGAPFAPGSGTVLYAGFRLRCLALPRAAPSYFAHFIGGTALRGRVYAGVSNAPTGFYRLSVANQSDTNTVQLAANLSTNTVYRVVVRYEVDAGTTRLWVNPQTEAEAGVTAQDGPGVPVDIDGFGFREDSSLGNGVFEVDELVVGRSFGAAAESAVGAVRLGWRRQGNALVLSWEAPGVWLARASNAAGPYLRVAVAAGAWTNELSGAAGFFRLEGP